MVRNNTKKLQPLTAEIHLNGARLHSLEGLKVFLRLRTETTMVTSLQRLGTLSMFFGSILYIIFLFEMSTVPQIASFQLVVSVSALIVGSIMSYGLKEIDDRFLKALGINVYLIGTGYECKSAFVYDATPLSYASCVLGGLLMMGGLILIYLKRGKPTESTINGQFYLGGLICVVGSAIMVLDIVLKTWTTNLRMLPETIDKAWIDISIGTLYLLNGALLQYIVIKKTDGRVEPDVVFFGDNNIFDQIFY
ncbi:hypothetical protein AVEN_211218-1 [Araneus ventricosus]|uniref:Uncharacterized protein n=1 Tax=Araneus ventricosus TaxID=182803 RepID=A0A4Y2M1G6_ARAVE|nr:hypothetical protein AVEN_211218-1 [Araneus ventricosus]